MDNGTRRLWWTLTGIISRASFRDLDGYEPFDGDSCDVNAAREAVMPLLEASGGRWTTDVSRGLMATLSSREVLDGQSTVEPLGKDMTAGCRACRIAAMLLAGQHADLAPDERDTVRRALRDDVDFVHLQEKFALVPPTTPPRPTTGPQTVPFSFPYRQGGPTGKGAKWLTVARDAVVLPCVSGEEAPRVASLKPHEGEWFGLRRMGDAFLRPVFSPGTWEPMSIDDFARVALSSPAWVDNPFLPRPERSQSVVALDEVAFPQVSRGRSDEGRLHAAAEAARTRAADLVVVDGVVHRPTGRPSLHVADRLSILGSRRKGTRKRVCIAWRLKGDLDAFTSQRSDRSRRLFPVGKLYANSLPGLSLGMVEQATELIRACALMTDLSFERHDHRTWEPDREAVRDVDPVAFPPDPTAMARIATDQIGRSKNLGHLLTEVGKMPGAPLDAEAMAHVAERLRGYCAIDGFLVRTLPDGSEVRVSNDSLHRAHNCLVAALARLAASELAMAHEAEEEMTLLRM